MPLFNGAKLFMSGVLLGSLLPWYMGVMMMAVFLFVDSKDFDLRHCAGCAISWAEGRCPLAVTRVILEVKRIIQIKPRSDVTGNGDILGEAYDYSPGV